MEQAIYFTENDFQVILNKPELRIGLGILWRGNKGEIIKVEGFGLLEPHYKKENYCVIKLEKPDEHNCTIIEVPKESFNYLTYPK